MARWWGWTWDPLVAGETRTIFRRRLWCWEASHGRIGRATRQSLVLERRACPRRIGIWHVAVVEMGVLLGCVTSRGHGTRITGQPAQKRSTRVTSLMALESSPSWFPHAGHRDFSLDMFRQAVSRRSHGGPGNQSAPQFCRVAPLLLELRAQGRSFFRRLCLRRKHAHGAPGYDRWLSCRWVFYWDVLRRVGMAPGVWKWHAGRKSTSTLVVCLQSAGMAAGFGSSPRPSPGAQGRATLLEKPVSGTA